MQKLKSAVTVICKRLLALFLYRKTSLYFPCNVPFPSHARFLLHVRNAPGKTAPCQEVSACVFFEHPSPLRFSLPTTRRGARKRRHDVNSDVLDAPNVRIAFRGRARRKTPILGSARQTLPACLRGMYRVRHHLPNVSKRGQKRPPVPKPECQKRSYVFVYFSQFFPRRLRRQ